MSSSVVHAQATRLSSRIPVRIQKLDTIQNLSISIKSSHAIHHFKLYTLPHLFSLFPPHHTYSLLAYATWQPSKALERPEYRFLSICMNSSCAANDLNGHVRHR